MTTEIAFLTTTKDLRRGDRLLTTRATGQDFTLPAFPHEESVTRTVQQVAPHRHGGGNQVVTFMDGTSSVVGSNGRWYALRPYTDGIPAGRS